MNVARHITAGTSLASLLHARVNTIYLSYGQYYVPALA
jgi:hypothetical protein